MSGLRRGGRHARASSALRARGRRAHETRRDGRAITTSTCTARVDGARDGAPVAFGLGSADCDATQPPEAGMRLHAIGILPRRDRLGRGPRKHVPSTPAACKSRVASSEDAILLFARVCDGQVRQSLADARARARSRRTAVFFPWGKCNRLVLHQKLQNNWSLVDKKCEIGLKKTRHVGSNLPEARKKKRFGFGEETPRPKASPRERHQSVATRRTRVFASSDG